MGAYLIDNPPRIDQFAARTRWAKSRPTGLTVLHTAESVMDTVGPDTGAEAVAEFIRTRSSYGSYHDLCDSDSVVPVVPYHLAAYQDGTGSNGFALSISFACRTSDWRAMGREARAGFLRQGARAFARQQAWLRANGFPTTPLRMVSKKESDRGAAGFIYHGHRDPGRRSDPGIAAPNLFPFEEWLDACRAALAGADLAPNAKPRRTKLMYLVRDNSTGNVYLVTPEGFRAIQTDEEWKCMVWLLDDDRDPDADAGALGKSDTFSLNARFVAVVAEILRRPIIANP